MTSHPQVSDREMRPHPGGLAGRVQDALDDLELITSDPNATDQAKRSAQMLADAMVAALRAETGGIITSRPPEG
jgi:hypothetical protein